MLNTPQLKNAIKNALLSQRDRQDNPEAAAEELAGAIAKGIEAYLKELQITYTAGLTAPNGPVAGTFQYELS